MTKLVARFEGIESFRTNQTQLLPPCLEDYVPPDAPVRFIDVFVDGLDLKQLRFQRFNISSSRMVCPSQEQRSLYRR